MPPKAAIVRQMSPTPPPPPPVANDGNDILIIQDFMDTIDQIPVELTRVHSDLNELGAVLYSTLCNLERKLHQLISWIQDPDIGPEQRFQLLQEIAEEAARYKLGGDDKIRVAGGACDGIMGHQRHISDLLASSTLLEQAPPSPYTRALTKPQPPQTTNTRRGVRAINSPFPGRDTNSGNALSLEAEKATPTKRKKNRVAQLGAKDDDDVLSLSGKEEKRKAPVKRKKANRAVSPSDSIASASVYGKPAEPIARTARQQAALTAAREKALKRDDSEDGSSNEEPKRGKAPVPQVPAASETLVGLGLDVAGSREGSAMASKGSNNTPAADVEKAGRSSRVRAGIKRNRDDEGEEEEDEVEEEEDSRPVKRTSGNSSGAVKKGASVQQYDELNVVEAEADGATGDNEVDSKVYCTCRQFSYGEMIGCDDDECEIEWYHVACLNLEKAPEGNWICPQCMERRKKNPKIKKAGKGGKRK